MRQIVKCELSYFSSAKAKVKTPKVKDAWSDTHIREIGANLRADMLLEEQNLLCAYCEKEIDENPENSNIDHFKTRNLFPELTLDYLNLLVSCETDGRCSKFKDKYIKTREEYENIVNPVLDNPNDYFEYLPTGEMIAKNGKGQFTIDIFNLNELSLIQCRKQIGVSLLYLEISLEEIYELFTDYHSFIKSIYPKLKEL